MTEETETVFPLLIPGVKLLRKGKTENKWIIRTMRIVTGRAIPLRYRTVPKPPGLPYLFLFMTGIAKRISFLP
jgi:hypothetical protein